MIIKNNQFYNLVDGKKIPMQNLEHKDYTNTYADSCLEMIERLGVWYIVAGTNDNEIVIYNHGDRKWHFAWKEFNTWRAHWIGKLPRNKIMEFDIYKIKYNRYTGFSRKTFYDLIIYVSNNTTCLKQDEVKKAKRIIFKSKGALKLTEEERIKANQAKMIGMDVLAVIGKMWNDGTWEATKVFNDYADSWIDLEKARMIWEWLKDNFRWTQKRLRELAKQHDSYKKIIENY